MIVGCDIHLYQEKRVNGKWVTADKWEPSEYEDEKGRLRVPFDKHLYWQRNYDVFAAIANVRNGYGFAGVVTGTPIQPISEPRGVPYDACPEYMAEVARWNGDGHSHSWLTLADIDAYDWSLPQQHRGVMTIEEYRRWKASGDVEPDEYAGDVSGPGIRIVSEEEARTLSPQASGEYGNATRYYVEAWWATSREHECREFLDAVRPRLQELEREYGKGNARIVFFFDN